MLRIYCPLQARCLQTLENTFCGFLSSNDFTHPAAVIVAEGFDYQIVYIIVSSCAFGT